MENQQLALDSLESCGTPSQAVSELLKHYTLRKLRFVLLLTLHCPHSCKDVKIILS